MVLAILPFATVTAGALLFGIVALAAFGIVLRFVVFLFSDDSKKKALLLKPRTPWGDNVPKTFDALSTSGPIPETATLPGTSMTHQQWRAHYRSLSPDIVVEKEGLFGVKQARYGGDLISGQQAENIDDRIWEARLYGYDHADADTTSSKSVVPSPTPTARVVVEAPVIPVPVARIRREYFLGTRFIGGIIAGAVFALFYLVLVAAFVEGMQYDVNVDSVLASLTFPLEEQRIETLVGRHGLVGVLAMYLLPFVGLLTTVWVVFQRPNLVVDWHCSLCDATVHAGMKSGKEPSVRECPRCKNVFYQRVK